MISIRRQFTVQLYLVRKELLSNLYSSLMIESKLYLLNQISEFTRDIDIDSGNLLFLSEQFLLKCQLILQTCNSSTTDLEAVEVTCLLEILARASGHEKWRNALQGHESLFLAAIGELNYLIHSIILVSK